MKYGKLKNGKVEYAGKAIRLDDGSVVVAPKEADLLAANYLPVVDEKPETDARHYAAPTGWEERDGAIRRTYEIREKPPRPPRTFSKLRIVAALTKAGVWAQVKSYIEQAGLYDLYLAAQDFAEDNEYFTQGKSQLQTALGWTDEQVEEILEKATIRSVP